MCMGNQSAEANDGHNEAVQKQRVCSSHLIGSSKDAYIRFIWFGLYKGNMHVMFIKDIKMENYTTSDSIKYMHMYARSWPVYVICSDD